MNTKTILIAALATTAAAGTVEIKVNVDDAYDLILDGEMVVDRANYWYQTQTYNFEIDEEEDHLLAITAIDYGGGYRASVEINGEGTKVSDWNCTGHSTSNLRGDVPIDYAQFAYDESTSNEEWLPARVAKSSSVNNGEAFWATGINDKAVIKCRYHGDLLGPQQPAYDGRAEYADLTMKLDIARGVGNVHADTQSELKAQIA